MKIKSLLIGMLASVALVGCTNDDPIDNGSNEQKQEAVRMDAYMTLSIASSTNSSRAVNDGTTTGDNHGNPEHSGHENNGTDAENQVNSIFVCFYNTATGSNDGFCNVYNMTAESEVSSTNRYNSYDTSFEKAADGTYKLSNPFALNTLGKYKVLIVLNPADAFKSQTANNATAAKTIYDNILTTYATSVSAIIGQDKNNFMMANRKEVTINVTKDNNDPLKAAVSEDGAIEVERVVSKITFRPNSVSTTYPNNGDLKNGYNLYTITETKFDYSVETENFWVLNADGVYNYLTDLYEAKSPDGKIYWVYFDGKGNQTRYTDTGKPYTGDLEDAKDVTANVVEASEYEGTIVFVGTKVESDEEPENYYVQLQRYALVNLNNKVYYVRHTSATPASATEKNYWGTVSTDNYLIEPNTKAKSGLTFDATNLVWPSGEASTYFTNDFKTVTDAVESGTDFDKYFKALPGTAANDAANNEVTPSDNPATGANPDYTNVGGLLDYCLENSILAANQNVLTSTGVIFEAQIYDKNGNIVPLMLEYQGSFYPSFIALVEATKEKEGDITTSPFWKYTDEDYDQMTDDQKVALATTLASNGVTLYRNGKCYYFSAEIKHYDDKSASKGAMEYAIMRNNIYSLAVKSVNRFGFSSINLASGIEDAESSTETEKVYLTMEAKILPWIVRFNDIEF